MSVLRILSRRELALVAAALLLPMPVFAMTGLNVPLPNAIERGLGELVTIEGQDQKSGTTARLEASANGSQVQRPAVGSLSVGRARRTKIGNARPGVVDASASRPDSNTRPESTTTPPETASPGGESGGGDTGSSGEAEQPAASAGGSPSADSPTSAGSPSVQIGVTGQGGGSDATVGGDGLTVDGGADGAGVGAGEPGRADATVTGSDGDSTGVGADIPSTGISLP